MKVVFGELDEMLSELREREIHEVRVAPLYDETCSKEGVPFMKVYVTVQALLAQQLYGPHEKVTVYLYGYYERVTFKGIKPFTKEEMKSFFDKNLKAKEEITHYIVESGFTVRGGHFEEE